MSIVSKSARRALIVAAVSLVPAFGMAEATTATAALVGNDVAASNEQQASGASNGVRAKVYCAGRTASGDTNITGSILKHKVCKTREQWLAEGVKIEDGK